MKEIRISIPEGVSEFSVQVNKDGVATVLYDVPVKKWEPEDGEILTNPKFGTICIYAGTNISGSIVSYAGLGCYGFLTTKKDSGWGYISEYRLATEEEKERLFGALAEKGLQWNAEKKELENIPRWRAVKNNKYYYVDNRFNIVLTCEILAHLDDNRYTSGNYFKTREAAEKVAEQIREIFKNSKAE